MGHPVSSWNGRPFGKQVVRAYHGYAGWMAIHEELMANTQTLIAQAYSAFNQRNLDDALALMSESVSWPKASEGGRVVGKEEIRAYWTRQWQEAMCFRIARCGTFIRSRTVSSNAWT
jgi:hypothetical protein